MIKKIAFKVLSFSLFFYTVPILAVCESFSKEDFDKLIKKEAPVTLVFFSSWCSDCKDELLEIKKKKQDKINYILVNTFDSPGKGEKALNSLGINYFCIYDKDRMLAKKYKIDSVPIKIKIAEES